MNRSTLPIHSDLWLQILQFFHDHPLSGHFGQNQTLESIQRQYTWPKIRKFIHDYVALCTVCGHNKPKWHKSYGLLKPLPVPLQPWDSISLDFIKQLSESNGYTAILVVVDWVFKPFSFLRTTQSLPNVLLNCLLFMSFLNTVFWTMLHLIGVLNLFQPFSML